MKLDRNISGNEGRGKYALLLLRRLAAFDDGKTFGGVDPKIADALKTLEDAGLLDWGEQGTESEFFLLRLKDEYADEALRAYAKVALMDDPEYANEVMSLARRAGPNNPFCKRPD